MARRSHAILVAFVTIAALSLSACGNNAASPALTDPKEILTKTVDAVGAASTVHLKVDLSGKLPIGDLGGLMGGGAAVSPAPGATAATIDLTGTTFEGDVDLKAPAADLTFTAPTLLNLTGEVIAVDQAIYVKASLLGAKFYRLGSNGATASPSPQPSASGSIATELGQALDQLTTPPTKLGDEQCGDTTCYHVQVTLDSADTTPLASIAPGVTGTGTLDVYVRQNDLRPSQLKLSADAGTAGSLQATVTFSHWDGSVSISAPPPDQVDANGLPIPSLLP